ncbi:MAG: hypothetical protein EXR99_13390 [Gemmataceae bacterium]|nr:hypothetical protein [Gemmataceae bacterium]
MAKILVPFWVATAFGVSLLYGGESLGQGDGLKEQFLSECHKAWSEYEVFLQTLQGKTITKRIYASKRPPQAGYIEIKQNTNCKMVLSQEQNEKSQDGVLHCQNLDYAFRLVRKSENEKWKLGQVHLSQPEGVVPSPMIQQIQTLRSTHSNPLLKLDTLTLQDLVQKKDFKILECKAMRFEDSNCVEIIFVSPHEVKPKNSGEFYSEQKGTMILDPSRSWVLRRADLDCSFKDEPNLKVQIETKIREGTNPKLPLPVSVEKKTK